MRNIQLRKLQKIAQRQSSPFDSSVLELQLERIEQLVIQIETSNHHKDADNFEKARQLER
jgi:hypothetical protein